MVGSFKRVPRNAFHRPRRQVSERWRRATLLPPNRYTPSKGTQHAESGSSGGDILCCAGAICALEHAAFLGFSRRPRRVRGDRRETGAFAVGPPEQRDKRGIIAVEEALGASPDQDELKGMIEGKATRRI